MNKDQTDLASGKKLNIRHVSIETMNPRMVIAQNCTWSAEYEEASFIAMLHEKGVWQREKYWLVEWALYELVKREEDCSELFGAIFSIYSYAMLSLSSHLDQNDLFRVVNLCEDEIYEFRERIQIVFESFFLEKFPNKQCLRRKIR